MGKETGYKIIIIIILIVSLYFIYFNKPENSSNEFINKIDSLECLVNKLSKVKDSIDIEIDTITVQIFENKVQYEKEYNNILDNDISEDYVFFSEYINKFKSRHDSINKF